MIKSLVLPPLLCRCTLRGAPSQQISSSSRSRADSEQEKPPVLCVMLLCDSEQMREKLVGGNCCWGTMWWFWTILYLNTTGSVSAHTSCSQYCSRSVQLVKSWGLSWVAFHIRSKSAGSSLSSSSAPGGIEKEAGSGPAGASGSVAALPFSSDISAISIGGCGGTSEGSMAEEGKSKKVNNSDKTSFCFTKMLFLITWSPVCTSEIWFWISMSHLPKIFSLDYRSATNNYFYYIHQSVLNLNLNINLLVSHSIQCHKILKIFIKSFRRPLWCLQFASCPTKNPTTGVIYRV